MPVVSREKLLQQLEAVQPGLSARELIEQSSCFVFQKKQVITYNDEIACRHDCDLKIKGAVVAAPLLSILRKMGEDELEIEPRDGELMIFGKKRKAGIKMEAEIMLPFDEHVESPTEWRPLDESFCDAISIVQQCCSKDESKPVATCVHIHPKYVEAFDNYQASRFRVKTKVKKPTLVRGESIKHIVSLGVTEFGETESWIHFRSPVGLIISCRRSYDDFPDIGSLLKIKGVPTTLPKGLGPAVDKAEVFSAENVDHNQVKVELRKGKLRIKGEGSLGWYSEIKSLKYDGPPMKFIIAPKLLMDITRKHNDCSIAPTQLKVDSGRFVYITTLDTDEHSQTDSDSDDEDSNGDE